MTFSKNIQNVEIDYFKTKPQRNRKMSLLCVCGLETEANIQLISKTNWTVDFEEFFVKVQRSSQIEIPVEILTSVSLWRWLR